VGPCRRAHPRCFSEKLQGLPALRLQTERTRRLSEGKPRIWTDLTLQVPFVKKKDGKQSVSRTAPTFKTLAMGKGVEMGWIRAASRTADYSKARRTWQLLSGLSTGRVQCRRELESQSESMGIPPSGDSRWKFHGRSVRGTPYASDSRPSSASASDSGLSSASTPATSSLFRNAFGRMTYATRS